MSRPRVEFHPDAVSEAEAAIDWYAQRSELAPVALLDELTEAVETIVSAPRRWPLLDSNCHRMPLFRFPYFIIYREKSPDLIQIVALAHAKRKPGYWHKRK
jgi:plasmid stabilization system protein ParE